MLQFQFQSRRASSDEPHRGSGFAERLRFSPPAIPVALLFFNIGVQIGQHLFIASVLAVIALARQVTRRTVVPWPAWGWRVPPYAIGSVAMFWVIQRLFVS